MAILRTGSLARDCALQGWKAFVYVVVYLGIEREYEECTSSLS